VAAGTLGRPTNPASEIALSLAPDPIAEPTGASSGPVPTSPPQTVPRVSLARPSIAYALFFGAIGAYFPYISLFYSGLGQGLEFVGILSALSAAVGLVAAPAWGAVADRIRDVRVPVLAGGLFAAASGAWLASAREPSSVALAVAAFAASFAGIGPLLDSRTVEILGVDRDRFGRARAWGSAGFIVVSIATGWIVGWYGATSIFAIYAPGLAIAGIASYVLLRGGTRRARIATGAGWGVALLDVFRSRSLSLFFVADVLMWTAISAVLTFVSIHMLDLGGDGSMVGLVWAIGAIVEVPLMLVFARFVRRIPAGRLVVIGAVAYAIRAFGWAVVSDPLLLLAFAPFGGVGYAFAYVGTVMYVSRAVPASVQATAQGLFSGTTFMLGSIAGAILGGQLSTALSIRGMFAVGGVLALVAAAGIWWAIGRSPATRRSSRTAS
jgi:MFS transporter, PPP family, 3-phenylpropionic acid transporter